MTSYKLYYFDIPGRAEPARWLFTLAGVEYEDVRIKFEDWKDQKIKLNPPFGQLPFLEIEEESGTWRLAHSHSIFRFLAKKFGLLGKCEKEIALGDSYVEQIIDAVNLIPLEGKEKKKNQKKMAEIIRTKVVEKLKPLEDCVQESGLFFGDEITLADVVFAVSVNFLIQVCPDALDPLPKLKALDEKVKGKEEIAKRIENMPQPLVFC